MDEILAELKEMRALLERELVTIPVTLPSGRQWEPQIWVIQDMFQNLAVRHPAIFGQLISKALGLQAATPGPKPKASSPSQ